MDSKTISDLSNELISLIKRNNFSDADVNKVKNAIDFATKYHKHQMRKSGEPYVTHPLAVAKIIASWELDVDSVCAGILHDTVEDTEATLDEIRDNFGESIAKLVDSVTKVSVYSDQNRASLTKTEIHQLEEKKQQTKTSNDDSKMAIIKVFLGMSKDIRVILIKLADRLHNMRTIKYLKAEKQIRIAQETRDIYANIASQLGMYQVKTEFDNLCMKILQPNEYKTTKLYIEKQLKKYNENFKEAIEKIEWTLNNNHIDAEVIHRIKSVASVYEKIKNNENVNDLFAVRIIVDKMLDCYLVLGVLHCNFMSFHNAFKDFISTPKSNLYQSLHTIIAYRSVNIEIQIRTKEMDIVANHGVAAHWKYKDKTNEFDSMFESIPSLLNYGKNIQNISMNAINKIARQRFINIFDKNKMERKVISDNISLIDYAYLSNKTKFTYIKKIIVNNKEENFYYSIQPNDSIEIVYSSNKTIQPKWEHYSRDPNVKKIIADELQKRNSNIENSSDLFINNILKETNSNINKTYVLEFIQKHFNIKTIKDFHDAMKTINISHSDLVKLFDNRKYNRKNIINNIKSQSWKWLIAKSLFQNDGINFPFNEIVITNCCSKIPPLDVVGVIHGDSLQVHNANCSKINKKDKIIVLKWDKEKIKKSDRSFKANVILNGIFTPEKSTAIIATITRYKGVISSFILNKKKESNEFIIKSEIYVKNYSNIEKIVNELISKGIINSWTLN